MKVKVEMEVRPWSAPNYVLCIVDGKEASIPIAAAGHDVVRHLVKAWMADVYQKAGMEPDWRFE